MAQMQPFASNCTASAQIETKVDFDGNMYFHQNPNYLTGEESSSQSSSETVEGQQRDFRREEEDGREVLHQEILEKARRSEMGPVVHHHQGIVETRRRGESQEGNNERESGFTESEFLLIMIIINPHNS